MAGSRIPGTMCQITAPVDVQDGTNALTPGPLPGPVCGPSASVCQPANYTTRDTSDVSFEIGASFLPVDTCLFGLDPAEMQVLAWLRNNRHHILGAERKFAVDRRAIAGAIAWEMLENVKTSPSRHLIGPGKMHLLPGSRNTLIKTAAQQLFGLLSGDSGKWTLAREVEEQGYLPKQSFESRKLLLATPEGAITYIAASMAAFSDMACTAGQPDIRNNPVILTNVFNSKTLTTWKEALDAKTSTGFAGGTPKDGNRMDIWVGSHLTFLEDAVDRPTCVLTATTTVPAGSADKVVEVTAGATLSGIAKAEYGSLDLWPLIYDQNRAKIGSNPNLIRLGLRLDVAPLSRYTSKEIAAAKQRASTWNQFK